MPDHTFVGRQAELRQLNKFLARTPAEALGSRRMLWQILVALAALQDDAAQAIQLFEQNNHESARASLQQALAAAEQRHYQ